MKVCSVDGCELSAERRDHGAAGMCKAHYQRKRRGVPMERPVDIKAPRNAYRADGATCSVEGCGETPHSRWLCASHSQSMRRKAAWRVKSPSERRANSLRKYGMDADSYDAMLKRQGGGCAICGCPPGVDSPSKSLHVDHDHGCCPGAGSCGDCVRGILCVFCNNALGGYEKTGYMPEPFRGYLARTASWVVA